MRMNCIDVDGTLTVGRDFFTDMAINALHINDGLLALRNIYRKDPKNFVTSLIKDTEDGLFGRIIKASLKRGDKLALTSMNSSPRYCLLILSMLGLSVEEIQSIYIRSKKFGDSKYSKLRQIQDAHKHFFGKDDLDSSEVKKTLIDDKDAICNDPSLIDLVDVVQVKEGGAYLKSYQSLLELSDSDLNCELQPIESRMDVFNRVEELNCLNALLELDRSIGARNIPSNVALFGCGFDENMNSMRSRHLANGAYVGAENEIEESFIEFGKSFDSPRLEKRSQAEILSDVEDIIKGGL